MALEVRQNLAAPPDSANRSATSWATSSPMALARLTARTAHDPCVSHPLDVADPSGPILVIQSYASTDISTSVIGMPRIKNCLRAMRVACFVPHHPSLLEAGFLYSARSPQSPLHRSYVAGRPTVDTIDAAEHLRRALHVYTSRAASALGIDAHAQQAYEANLGTLTGPLSAGDDHDNL